MRVILVRHGNTFGPGMKVVWVGANTDMPLVEEGHAQAQRVGEAVRRAGLNVRRVYTGPLLRTKETAADIASVLELRSEAIVVAGNLREIDYGLWEGKSNDEIRALYGADALDGWQKRSVWPEGFGWAPAEKEIRANWNALMVEIQASHYDAQEAVMLVSSNGIYRVIAASLGVPPELAKMNTGFLSVLDTNDIANTLLWNVDPKTFVLE